jgi:hypothetical protein
MRKLETGSLPDAIAGDESLTYACHALQLLLPKEGAFVKTSARSCKDVALGIGLEDHYRTLLRREIAQTGTHRLDEMRLRGLFMEAGRQVLKFSRADDVLCAFIQSNRVCGVSLGRTVLT